MVQCVAALGAESQLKLLDDVVAKSALTEVAHSDGLSVAMVVEDVLEILVGKVVDEEEALADALCLLLFVGEFALLDFDAILLGQPLERFVIVELLMLHDEVYHVAALAAAEALAHPLRW